MAILPNQQAIEEAIRSNPSAGPKAITIADYLKRKGPIIKKELPVPPKQKTRGGWKVKIRRQLGELYRLAAIATTKAEKQNFIRQIKALEEKRNNGMVLKRYQGRHSTQQQRCQQFNKQR